MIGDIQTILLTSEKESHTAVTDGKLIVAAETFIQFNCECLLTHDLI